MLTKEENAYILKLVNDKWYYAIKNSTRYSSKTIDFITGLRSKLEKKYTKKIRGAVR